MNQWASVAGSIDSASDYLKPDTAATCIRLHVQMCSKHWFPIQIQYNPEGFPMQIQYNPCKVTQGDPHYAASAQCMIMIVLKVLHTFWRATAGQARSVSKVPSMTIDQHGVRVQLLSTASASR